jgi:hypothetical protein
MAACDKKRGAYKALQLHSMALAGPEEVICAGITSDHVHNTSPDTQHPKPQEDIDVDKLYDYIHGQQPGKLF